MVACAPAGGRCAVGRLNRRPPSPAPTFMTTTTPLDPARERLLLLTLAGIQFAHILDFMIMMPLGPMLMKELGVGTHEFGLLVSSYTFSAAFTGLLAAMFVDRFERKRLLLTMFGLFAVATLACGLAPGYWTLLAARGTAGAFGGVLGSMVQTMVGDLIPFERRGRASGTIMSAFSLSTVAGVPLSLYLANHFGWRFPFYFIALLSCGLLALGWKMLPELRGHLPSADVNEESAPIRFSAMFEVLRDANHRRALLFMALIMVSGFSVIPYITIYITSNVNIRIEDIPLIYLFGGAATFFTSRLIGRLADRHGKIRVYRLVAFGSLLPLLVITHLWPVPLVAADLLVHRVLHPGAGAHGAGDGGGHFGGAAAPARHLPVDERCRAATGSGAASWLGGVMIAADATGRVPATTMSAGWPPPRRCWRSPLSAASRCTPGRRRLSSFRRRPFAAPAGCSVRRISTTPGPVFSSKPSLRARSCMRVFSLRVSPRSMPMPRLRAQSTRLSIRRRPSPPPLTSEATRMANSASDVVRVGHHARLAQRTLDALGIAFDRHQRDLAVVVDLGEARQLRARQLAHGAEEAHARILGVERGDQVGQRGFVLRPDRPDQQLAPLPVDVLLQFLGVGADGEAAEAERRPRFRHGCAVRAPPRRWSRHGSDRVRWR
jgi:predicted MFS family arabinose efflux permease